MSIDRILSQLLSGGVGAGLAGVLAGGLLTSKVGRKVGKGALELGGAAAIAGLAYTAWQKYQRGNAQGAEGEKSAEPTPTVLRAAGFLPALQQANGEDALARELLRAMLAAARADGKLDTGEWRKLSEHIARAEIGEVERAALYAELEKPVSIDEVVAVATTPARAIELYTASLLAIEVDSAAERGYLAMLAARLGLDEALVASIHREAIPASRAGEVVLPAAPA